MTQLSLIKDSMQPASSRNLEEKFRKIYYDLYSNSNSSRPEAILSDLSLILFLKLASEQHNISGLKDCLTCNDDRPLSQILEILRGEFPALPVSNSTLTKDTASQILTELRDVELSKAPSHALGDAFQALIGPRIRGDKGQFFTPRCLVHAMVEVLCPSEGAFVLDPACGTGGFLTEVYTYVKARSDSTSPPIHLFGVDKDQGMTGLASSVTQIMGARDSAIFNFNSLDPRSWERHVGNGPRRFDIVLTNPPFGTKIGVKDPEILRHYDLAHQWEYNQKTSQWEKQEQLLTSQDPQVLFVELCVNKLSPNGQLGIVLPEGLFGNKRSGYLWEWLRTKGEITAMIDCPRTTFQPGTDTKTNVLFFRRKTTDTHTEKTCGFTATPVKVAIALNCGHDRRGRPTQSNGTPYPDDFLEIGKTYSEEMTKKQVWHEVMITDPYYLVPRFYVGTEELDSRFRDIPKATLGELMEEGLLDIRSGHEVGSDAYGTGNIPFVRTSDIANFEIRSNPTKSVSEDVYCDYASKQKLAPGDILLVEDGRYRIGATAILTQNNYRCVIQSHLKIIRSLRPDVLDPYGILYILNLPTVRQRLRNLVFIQSTLGTLGRRLFELEFPLIMQSEEWAAKIRDFREILQTRDQALAQLQESEIIEDVEL